MRGLLTAFVESEVERYNSKDTEAPLLSCLTAEEIEAYYEKTAKDVGATADDVKRYFGEEFLKNELKKEQAMNLIIENAVAKSADEMEPEEAAKELKEEFADEVAGEAVAEAVEQAEEKAE